MADVLAPPRQNKLFCRSGGSAAFFQVRRPMLIIPLSRINLQRIGPMTDRGLKLALAFMLGLGAGACAHQVNSPPSIAASKHTPAGAMNAFCHAVETGDVDAVADSYDPPSDLSSRMALARAQIAADRLVRAATKRLGPEATHELILWLTRGGYVEPMRVFTAHDFRRSPNPGQVDGDFGSGGSWLPMVHGPSGTWYILLGWFPFDSQTQAHEIDLQDTQAAVFGKYALAMEQGLTPTIYQIFDWSDFENERLANRWLWKQWPVQGAESNGITQAAKTASSAKTFDRSTLQGAIAAYQQAFNDRDAKGLAGFLYCRNDSRHEFAAAYAKRILAILKLKDAIDQKFASNGEALVFDDTGLLSHADLVWFCDVEEQKGNHATGYFEDNSKVVFRRDAGIWKRDVTPPDGRATRLEIDQLLHDCSIIDQITSNVMAGKYKQLFEVTDAVFSAKLGNKQARE